ncbi:hypothetical protein CJA_2442 [Cellvibrio japonicus Ueda107]|uniref:Uncharacterized protein n=1 Tax=Cellvibrio japonicus (strain Ueda107) TaxID=498211 RepID=B3PKH4_CELJU|nr:hypothetical protein CJA_2442 [Cellvibrio japonicus Ueda107]
MPLSLVDGATKGKYKGSPKKIPGDITRVAVALRRQSDDNARLLRRPGSQLPRLQAAMVI